MSLATALPRHTGIGGFDNGSQFFDLSAAGPQSFNNVTIGGHQFTITELGDGTVNVSGVVTGTQVGVFTLNGYNSLEYSYVSGERIPDRPVRCFRSDGRVGELRRADRAR